MGSIPGLPESFRQWSQQLQQQQQKPEENPTKAEEGWVHLCRESAAGHRLTGETEARGKVSKRLFRSADLSLKSPRTLVSFYATAKLTSGKDWSMLNSPSVPLLLHPDWSRWRRCTEPGRRSWGGWRGTWRTPGAPWRTWRAAPRTSSSASTGPWPSMPTTWWSVSRRRSEVTANGWTKCYCGVWVLLLLLRIGNAYSSAADFTKAFKFVCDILSSFGANSPIGGATIRGQSQAITSPPSPCINNETWCTFLDLVASWE